MKACMSNKITLIELQHALACVPVKTPEHTDAQYKTELEIYWFTLGTFAEVMRQWDVADHVLSVVRDISPAKLDALQCQAFDAGTEAVNL